MDGCVAQPTLKGNDATFLGGCKQGVCSVLPQCCSTKWDATCAQACATIMGGGCTGGIYRVPWEKGCSQRGCDCQSCVCANDPFCCATSWDESCALECWSVSLISPGAKPPAPSETVCYKSDVCLLDSYCCSVSWDNDCKLYCQILAGC
jgi:hypothetical protein